MDNKYKYTYERTANYCFKETDGLIYICNYFLLQKVKKKNKESFDCYNKLNIWIVNLSL